MTSRSHSAAAAVPAAELATQAAALSSSLAETWKTMSGLSVPMPTLAQLQADYLKASTELWNQTLPVSYTHLTLPTKRIV